MVVKVQLLGWGGVVIIAVFNLDIASLFYPCQLTYPWVKLSLGEFLLLLVLYPPRAFHLLPSSADLGEGTQGEDQLS